MRICDVFKPLPQRPVCSDWSEWVMFVVIQSYYMHPRTEFNQYDTDEMSLNESTDGISGDRAWVESCDERNREKKLRNVSFLISLVSFFSSDVCWLKSKKAISFQKDSKSLLILCDLTVKLRSVLVDGHFTLLITLNVFVSLALRLYQQQKRGYFPFIYMSGHQTSLITDPLFYCWTSGVGCCVIYL